MVGTSYKTPNILSLNERFLHSVLHSEGPLLKLGSTVVQCIKCPS